MSHPEQYNIVLLSELSAPTDSAPLTSDGLQLKFEALSNNLINFRISSFTIINVSNVCRVIMDCQKMMIVSGQWRLTENTVGAGAGCSTTPTLPLTPTTWAGLG